MKNLILFGIFFLSLSSLSYGELKSPFASSISLISTSNAHYVDSSGQVLRSMAPSKTELREFLDLGVTDIIIFKNETRDEVQKELISISEIGQGKMVAHHIPFRWNNFESEKVACLLSLKALRVIKKVKDKSGKVLFHCTVGEDRTGYLAGLYKILEGFDLNEVFQNEMCKKGYERGNPNKPWHVVNLIRKSLTPLFLKMADLVEKGILNQELDDSVCDHIDEIKVDTTDYICKEQLL